MLINKKKCRTYLKKNNDIVCRRIQIVVINSIIFIKSRWCQTTMIDDNDVVIHLILSYEATIDMITSFAVDVCFVEMFDCSATFRKRTKTRCLVATRETRLFHRTLTKLNENDVQVRWTMNVYLIKSYIVAYELHIQSRKNKQSQIRCIVNEFSQLLIIHHENEILMRSDLTSDNDLIVNDECHRTIWKKWKV
jgi:hypothetical protein